MSHIRHILIACLLIASSALALASPSHPAGAAKPDGGGFGHPTATPTPALPTATATWTALPTSTPPAGTPTQTPIPTITPTPGGCPALQIDAAFGANLTAALQQYRNRVLAYWPDPCVVQHLYATNYRDPVTGSIAWHNGGNAYVDVVGQNQDTIALDASHELAEATSDPFPYKYISGPFSGNCTGCPGGSFTGTVQFEAENVDPIQGAGAVVIGTWWFADFSTPSYFAGGAPPYDAIGGVQHHGSPCWGELDFLLPGGALASAYSGAC